MEIAIIALWTALWLHPKWAILNKGGILLVLLAAPAIALIGWIKPDWLETVVYWWTAYLAVFLAVGGGIVATRTHGDSALAVESRQPTGFWFPVLARASVPLAKRLPLFLLMGAFVGAVGVMLGHAPLLAAALGGLAIALLPALPFIYLLLAVRLADFLSGAPPGAT
jgi:hypothetical protein